MKPSLLCATSRMGRIFFTLASYCCMFAAGFQIASAQTCVPPPMGMVSWWRGDGNAGDIKGGNNGVLQNGATFATGLVGQAFRFDGMNDFVLVPHSPNLDGGSDSPLTLELWVNRTGSGSIQHIAGKRVGCSGGMGFYQIAIGPGAFSVTDIPLNTWVHLAITYDKDGLYRVYRNGSLFQAFRWVVQPNTVPFTIGTAGSCAPFEGLIDEVAFYNRVLSEAEIQAIYNAGRTGKCKVTIVSAASFKGESLASESIASSFGISLAGAVVTAPPILPLPTALAGTTIRITDKAGDERLAPLFFVSPSQVNLQIPPGTAIGTASLAITSGDGTVSFGRLEIEPVSPGLFAVNVDGQGVAAAVALRIRADSSQSIEPIARFDQAQGKFVAIQVDLGPESDQVFLVLFGTGIRFHSSPANVMAKIGGVDSQILYAGPAPDFVGLDQVNVSLPRSLIGRGEVDIVLMVEGKTANTVKVNVK